MIKVDPIIAVKNVAASAEWYQKVFGLKCNHGGDEFAVLASENNDIVLCLHKWGAHEHPTMTNPNLVAGNGLILYFKTDKLDIVKQRVDDNHIKIEEDIHENESSLKKEFSLRDPDGYFIIVTEYHEYEG